MTIFKLTKGVDASFLSLFGMYSWIADTACLHASHTDGDHTRSQHMSPHQSQPAWHMMWECVDLHKSYVWCD